MNQLTHPFHMIHIGTRTPGTGGATGPEGIMSPDEDARRTTGRARTQSQRAAGGKVPFTRFIF